MREIEKKCFLLCAHKDTCAHVHLSADFASFFFGNAKAGIQRNTSRERIQGSQLPDRCQCMRYNTKGIPITTQLFCFSFPLPLPCCLPIFPLLSLLRTLSLTLLLSLQLIFFIATPVTLPTLPITLLLSLSFSLCHPPPPLLHAKWKG